MSFVETLHNRLHIVFMIWMIVRVEILYHKTSDSQSRIGALERRCRLLQTLAQESHQFDLILSDNSSHGFQQQKKLHSLLQTKMIVGHNLIRVGRGNDGGYLMVDSFRPNQVAYSFGISDDTSWDQDIADRHIHCYMYDHTIKKLPSKNNYFHWFKIGIRGKKRVKNCETLKTLLQKNGHLNHTDLILKVDVEGSEWDVLSDTDSTIFNLFDQIVLELHDLLDLQLADKRIQGLSNIAKTHQAVWIHANNYDENYVKRIGNLVTPNTVEVLFVRKQSYQFEDNTTSFPLPLDMPNNPKKAEIYLGKWNV